MLSVTSSRRERALASHTRPTPAEGEMSAAGTSPACFTARLRL